MRCVQFGMCVNSVSTVHFRFVLLFIFHVVLRWIDDRYWLNSWSQALFDLYYIKFHVAFKWNFIWIIIISFFFFSFCLAKKKGVTHVWHSVPTKPTLIVKMVDIVVLKANVSYIRLQISFIDLNHITYLQWNWKERKREDI